MKILTILLLLAALLTGCQQKSLPATESQSTQPTQGTHPQVAVFREQLLVDNQVCMATVRSLEPEGTFGYTMELYLENRADRELLFSLQEVSVNGFMCDPFFATTVSPGKKAQEAVSFLWEELSASGIEEVTELEFTLVASSSTDLLEEPLVQEHARVYPLGKEAARVYSRNPQPEDQVLFDSADCAMTVTGFDPDSFWGYAMGVYLENRTGDSLMFTVSNVSVNGFMCDPYWAVEVAPGKKCYSQITWMDQELADKGIAQVESVSLPVRVYDSQDWQAPALVETTFAITP